VSTINIQPIGNQVFLLDKNGDPIHGRYTLSRYLQAFIRDRGYVIDPKGGGLSAPGVDIPVDNKFGVGGIIHAGFVGKGATILGAVESYGYIGGCTTIQGGVDIQAGAEVRNHAKVSNSASGSQNRVVIGTNVTIEDKVCVMSGIRIYSPYGRLRIGGRGILYCPEGMRDITWLGGDWEVSLPSITLQNPSRIIEAFRQYSR
jgi:acetyltransferase-like isoleucine patch superfamily enzyme